MPQLTFKEVCDFIKKDKPELLETVDKMMGLALICAPLALGPAALACLPLLTAKNELVKIGKSIFEAVTRKKEEDYFSRNERMQIAYGLIIYTAFFETVDELLPEVLRKAMDASELEKAYRGASSALKGRSVVAASLEGDDATADRYTTVEISFPHPAASLGELERSHVDLYKRMIDGFIGFLHRLPAWEKLSPDERNKLVQTLNRVPEASIAVFEAQYFELCKRYEEFAIWANLHEHKNTKHLIESLSRYVRDYVSLSSSRKSSLDIGFTKLHSAILSIPEHLNLTHAEELSAALKKHYDARINDPIVEDKEETEDERSHLVFPRIRDAFIPQSYRVLRQTSKSRKLEDEETWKSIPRRDDLGAFLLSYLTSPYSTDSPLLILGHPGSGKSLLTKVLSAQLMSRQFTAIRVVLREVDSEASVVAQIEEQISRTVAPHVDSWVKIASLFKNNPPVVILDGYDELLQASGKVFSGYLKVVQEFQKYQAEQGRPVRAIVTSRVTLIDKATIPYGSTVLRLLEFDEQQRERWISIWNKTNRHYFDQAGIEPFSVPKDDTDSSKILSLAEQPLLLLMLALYDSENNKLKNSKAIDRTVLYESLLRRFVQRERMKDQDFQQSTSLDRNKELDREMQRLGVAAVGMYNRRKLHILSPELGEDLKFFRLERPRVGRGPTTFSSRPFTWQLFLRSQIEGHPKSWKCGTPRRISSVRVLA